METLFFSFHDLAAMAVTGSGTALAKFRKEFEYHRVEKLDGDPDIEVVLGDFAFQAKSGTRIVDKRYHLTEDAVYAEDGYKVARWKVMIEGLERKTTRVRLAGNLPTNVIAARWFGETILRVKMVLAGKPMVHSSCLTDGTHGHVLSASPSTGKTTILLSWLADGNPFCCDEYSILDTGKVHSYVTPFRFHSHNLEMNPILKDLPQSDRTQIRARTALLKATGGYADVTWDVNIREALPKVPIAKNCALTSLHVLTRANIEKLEVIERPVQQIVSMLQRINEFELRGFAPYLRAWGYAHPDGDVANYTQREKEALTQVLKDVPVAELRIPSDFRRTTYDQVVQVMRKLQN
jgi:hypothetical protein